MAEILTCKKWGQTGEKIDLYNCRLRREDQFDEGLSCKRCQVFKAEKNSLYKVISNNGRDEDAACAWLADRAGYDHEAIAAYFSVSLEEAKRLISRAEQRQSARQAVAVQQQAGVPTPHGEGRCQV